MPQVVATTVYRLDELSDAAREAARAWYRQADLDADWYEAVYEDFERVCGLLGVDLRTRPVRLMGGGTRDDPCIWFTGFWSQGDGACFEGGYAYRKGAARRIRSYAPKDADLQEIADTLQAVQRRNLYQLQARIRHRGRYTHEYAMDILVERDSATGQDMTPDGETAVIEALRDLARWLYRRLETEHAYLTSDEQVDQGIEASEFTFTEDGERFG
jgi:hypothetical protein